MFQAQLKGKLSRQEEDLEDLLTSNVFGALKYISYEEGLLPLLHSIVDEYGNHPLRQIHNIQFARYEFWPFLNEPNCIPCEPDVLINIEETSGNKYLILIEAKYLSRKSSPASEDDKPADQLAKEWDNLLSYSNKKRIEPFLIYITAHTEIPIGDISESKKEYSEKRGSDIKVGWLSWRMIIDIFKESQNEIIKDLISILKKQGLILFRGFSKIPDYKIGWEFRPNLADITFFYWKMQTEPIDWEFLKEPFFEWKKFWGYYRLNWRFING